MFRNHFVSYVTPFRVSPFHFVSRICVPLQRCQNLVRRRFRHSSLFRLLFHVAIGVSTVDRLRIHVTLCMEMKMFATDRTSWQSAIMRATVTLRRSLVQQISRALAGVRFVRSFIIVQWHMRYG
jgi:hypothetical protein